jgi:hypothetical protein
VHQIRAERARAARAAAKAQERAELEAAGQLREQRPPAVLRDSREDLHKLLESFRVAPDGTERWPLAGDADMRRRQRHSPSPEAAAAAEAASRAKALAIVAESRARRAGQVPDAQ